MNPLAFEEGTTLDPYTAQLNRLYLAGLITLEEEFELLDPVLRSQEPA